jgi:hypothetical protein
MKGSHGPNYDVVWANMLLQCGAALIVVWSRWAHRASPSKSFNIRHIILPLTIVTATVRSDRPIRQAKGEQLWSPIFIVGIPRPNSDDTERGFFSMDCD